MISLSNILIYRHRSYDEEIDKAMIEKTEIKKLLKELSK